MISLRTFFAVVALSLLAAPIFAAEAPQRQTLEKAIPYAISLLEAKNYKGFLESFMAPYELKEQTASKSLDEVAQSFGKRKAADMLKLLNSLKNLKPTYEADGSIASYQLPGDKRVSFVRVGKYWYISG